MCRVRSCCRWCCPMLSARRCGAGRASGRRRRRWRAGEDRAGVRGRGRGRAADRSRPGPGCRGRSVRKWRVRFWRAGWRAWDGPRPGAPRKITDEQVEGVVTRTLTEQGRGQDTHWSTRSMAAETGLSQTAVSRIWRAFGLKPHLVETGSCRRTRSSSTRSATWSGSTCPRRRTRWSWRGREVADPGPGPDRPVLPMLPATPARMTHDYVRHGTTSLFAALDMATGSVIAQPYRRHRHQEFLRFLKLIDAAVPKTWTSTWSWTTTPPTRPPRSSSGCCGTRGSTCTSPRPAHPG